MDYRNGKLSVTEQGPLNAGKSAFYVKCGFCWGEFRQRLPGLYFLDIDMAMKTASVVNKEGGWTISYKITTS